MQLRVGEMAQGKSYRSNTREDTQPSCGCVKHQSVAAYAYFQLASSHSSFAPAGASASVWRGEEAWLLRDKPVSMGATSGLKIAGRHNRHRYLAPIDLLGATMPARQHTSSLRALPCCAPSHGQPTPQSPRYLASHATTPPP